MQMIKNVNELIKEKFEIWDLPMGPFNETADIANDMSRFADLLGDEQADEFVKSLLWQIDHKYPHLEVVYEFLDIYLQKYRQSIVAAAIKYLTPQGPLLLVEMLGASKDETIVDLLVKTIDLASATEELLIALIGAIGEIGGIEALKELQNLRSTLGDTVSQQVVMEFETAIANAERALT